MAHFHSQPETYLEQIRSEVSGYDELQARAVGAVPFAPDRVLELGMGTGETTSRLLESFPDAWVIGLDSSPEMVFRARETYDDVQLARMEDPLPDGPWDLVISVLAVNALSAEQIKALCRRVGEQSRSLVIGDVVRTQESPEAGTEDLSTAAELAEWCGGEVVWQQDALAVVRADYR